MSIRLLLLFCITIVFSQLFSSCEYKNEVDLYSCDTVSVSFNGKILPIFEQNCFPCHSSANAHTLGGHNELEGYDKIRTYIELYGLILGNIKHEPDFKPMPFNNPKLKDCEIAKIEKWVNEGFPE